MIKPKNTKPDFAKMIEEIAYEIEKGPKPDWTIPNVHKHLLLAMERAYSEGCEAGRAEKTNEEIL